MKVRILTLFLLFLGLSAARAQQLPHPDSVDMLITNLAIQIECTDAMNDLYNFKYDRAESQFQWLRRTYPEHPIGYFLMGLSTWWRIVPKVEDEKLDERLMAYMDTAITKAEEIYDNPRSKNAKIEAAFFLSASYGFQGRILSERKNWARATVVGKRAIKYMEEASGNGDLSPELLFGDGLYNYYAVWIPENYPALKPVLWFFENGDKEKGIKQLEQVVGEGFYTRTEAQFFLMRIYSDEEEHKKSLQMAEYLYNTFPGNAYFHRYYAKALYMNGHIPKLKKVSLDLMMKVDSSYAGYEEHSGRYAGFFLGYIFKRFQKDNAKAKYYLEKAIQYSEKIKATEAGYYLYALSYLAQIRAEEGDIRGAKRLYEKIKDNAERKHATHKEAREFLKKHRRE